MAGTSGMGVYVKVFSDLIEDSNEFLEEVSQFQSLAAFLWESSDRVAYLCSPSVPRSSREKVVADALVKAGVSDVVRKTTLVMLKKGRIQLLPNFIKELREFADERCGILRGTVESASELSAENKSQLESCLAAATQRQAEMSYKVHKDVLGGFKSRTPQGVADFTLAKKLQNAKSKLIQVRT
jgi:F-type H+-transporting ATPase subunit delta